MNFIRVFLLLFIIFYSLKADTLKPALVEITFFEKNRLEITFELNLEAILSGISTAYKNTQNAPDSTKYDELRILKKEELRKKFIANQEVFLNNISLKINNKKIDFSLKNIDIDIVGYTKRARKSIITYEANIQEIPKNLKWKYNKKYGDSAFRYRVYEKNKYTWSDWSWLTGNTGSKPININYKIHKSKLDIFIQFISIGFLHVIPMGLDHILFIIGMALAPVIWKQLLILVTSFTIAHTLTLGLSMVEIINLPSLIIEPLIAFSIAYIAIENLLKKQSIKRKTLIVFGFGLLHGMGFASMLKTFEMNGGNFLYTLIGFNIGVEIAQVLIVFIVLMMIFLIKKYSSFYKDFMQKISIGIVIIALYWTIERLY